MQFQSEDLHGHDESSLYIMDGVLGGRKRRFDRNNYHQFAVSFDLPLDGLKYE